LTRAGPEEGIWAHGIAGFRNFNIADSDSIYFFISSSALAERDFSRMEAGFTQG
jgi:hypothetical protein